MKLLVTSTWFRRNLGIRQTVRQSGGFISTCYAGDSHGACCEVSKMLLPVFWSSQSIILCTVLCGPLRSLQWLVSILKYLVFYRSRCFEYRSPQIIIISAKSASIDQLLVTPTGFRSTSTGRFIELSAAYIASISPISSMFFRRLGGAKLEIPITLIKMFLSCLYSVSSWESIIICTVFFPLMKQYLEFTISVLCRRL